MGHDFLEPVGIGVTEAAKKLGAVTIIFFTVSMASRESHRR